jgi:hypothetical protein|nr:MAG TPA_asm: hypothetical protein [Caudoviricetes sp.]
MKARLAKKIAHMPINRLSPRWLDRFIGGDERIYEAVRKWSKKSRKKALERLRKELKESDELLDKLEREKQRKE